MKSTDLVVANNILQFLFLDEDVDTPSGVLDAFRAEFSEQGSLQWSAKTLKENVQYVYARKYRVFIFFSENSEDIHIFKGAKETRISDTASMVDNAKFEKCGVLKNPSSCIQALEYQHLLDLLDYEGIDGKAWIQEEIEKNNVAYISQNNDGISFLFNGNVLHLSQKKEKMDV